MTSESRPSLTAILTCLIRSVHTKLDRPALIEDDWADRLVLAEEKSEWVARSLARLPQEDRDRLAGDADLPLHAAWRARPVYGSVVARTRYTEDRLRIAVGQGVRQHVVIGAGFDSFGLRRPEFARDVRVFEIDHPATQSLKRERLAACGAMIPSTLNYIPADLRAVELGAALTGTGFRFDEPVVFSFLGVSMYLPREANVALFRAMAQVMAPGSELVLTYVEQSVLDSPRLPGSRAWATAIGEPWLCGFDSSTISSELLEPGMVLVEDLDGASLHQRYCADRTDGLLRGADDRTGHVALARVAARPAEFRQR